MSTATEPNTRRRRKPETEGEPKGLRATLPPTKSRRRPAIIAAGVALAIVGGLASWYYASSVGNTVTVLITAHDITRGDTIDSAELTTIQIAGGQTTNTFTAAESPEVIGQIATVDLPTGTLLTSGNIGSGLAVKSGESIIGVALSASQLPSYLLAAGDSIRIVDTPIAQGEPPTSTPNTFKATVFTTKFDEASAKWIVDLVVPTSQAADIAARAATGRIALILDAVSK